MARNAPPQRFHDLGKQGEGAKTLIGGPFGSSGGHFGAADQLFGGSKMAAGRPNRRKASAAIGADPYSDPQKGITIWILR